MSHSKYEWLVALIRTAVQKIRRLSIRARHDYSGHAHYIELESGRIQSLNLFVLRDQHFAALVPTLLHAGLLIFDVISGNTDLDKAPNQISNVGIATMSRICVRNDEWPIIVLWCSCSLFRCHARAHVVLVLVGR